MLSENIPEATTTTPSGTVEHNQPADPPPAFSSSIQAVAQEVLTPSHLLKKVSEPS